MLFELFKLFFKNNLDGLCLYCISCLPFVM